MVVQEPLVLPAAPRWPDRIQEVPGEGGDPGEDNDGDPHKGLANRGTPAMRAVTYVHPTGEGGGYGLVIRNLAFMGQLV